MTADNPMDIKINAKASANFDHILKAIPKGLSKLCYLFLGKHEADIARYQMLTAAQTEYDYQNIILGTYSFQNGCLVQLQNEMASDKLNSLQIGEKQEIKNFSNNIKIAAESLRNVPDEEVSNQSIDDDFFARWRREARVIGNSDLQQLWGRLLAEEIKNPDTISFRELDILKNITSQEARLFQSIAHLILPPGFLVYNKDEDRWPPGITLEKLCLLHDCGLIKDIRHDGITAYAGESAVINDTLYMAIKISNFLLAAEYREKMIAFPGIPLTAAGQIAFRICDKIIPTPDAIEYVCRSMIDDPDNQLGKIVVFKNNCEDGVQKYIFVQEITRQNPW